jgi:CBF1 interacting corepressor
MEHVQVEAMQAVGFMYMRPPGYNAESARAAEIADERRKLGLDVPAAPSQNVSLSVAPEGYACFVVFLDTTVIFHPL